MELGINETAERIHLQAHKSGFYRFPCSPPCRHRSGGRAGALMLIVSELAEALEADREGDVSGFGEELADAAIRLLDLAAAEEIDLERWIAMKMIRNAERPYRHGKKY